MERQRYRPGQGLEARECARPEVGAWTQAGMGRSSRPTLSVPRGPRSARAQHAATRAALLLAGERLYDLLHEVQGNHTGLYRGHTDHMGCTEASQ